jgi:hypothetical protein
MDLIPLKDLSYGSLLNQNINSAAAQAAGIPRPYAGFNSSVAQALRPYPQYTSVSDYAAELGNQSYNSFQLNVQRHFGDLTFLANVTAAKNLSNADNPGQRPQNASLKAQTIEVRQTAKSLAGFNAGAVGQSGDIAKQLKLSWYWDVPVGRGKHFLSDANKPLDFLVSNWRFSALQYYMSGQPIGLSTNQSIPGLGGVWPVPNQGVPIKAVGGCGDVHPLSPARAPT